jgi:hypothetical protein
VSGANLAPLSARVLTPLLRHLPKALHAIAHPRLSRVVP